MAFSNKSFSDTEKAILTTILYSDIFHFPLTSEELWKFLISSKSITKQAFSHTLQALDKNIFSKDGYYCLPDNESIIEQRKKQQAEVRKKMHIAKRAAFYLSHIPTIKFIGITGGLALENAAKDDDIDFFIIVKKGTLFTTRLWILALLEWRGMRRKRGEKHPADKICVNLLLDETRLSWPLKRRDLYTAHEIAQIKPLFDRNNTYQKFMESNGWIKTFLPNCLDERYIFWGTARVADYYLLRFVGFFLSLSPFEALLRRLQQDYMKKHKTTETVTKTLLALHPNDYRVNTLTILRSKCEKLGLLTNP